MDNPACPVACPGTDAPPAGTPVSPVVYLNNAATGWPPAPGVVEAMVAAQERMPGASGRGNGRESLEAEMCREGVARLLGATDPSRVALTPGATHALNAVWWGLDLRPGAHVVTTVTEHNSVLRPLHHLAERTPGGLRVTTVGVLPDGALDIDAMLRVLEEGADVVALCHASNVTGLVADARYVFQAARRVGARTVLDACQSAWHVPVHPGELLADVVVLTAHKVAHGPGGVGALYVAPELELRPWVVGGTGVRSDLRAHPPEMPLRLEAGTPNLAALAGFQAALAWQEAHGRSCAARACALSRRLREGLGGLPGVRVLGDGAAACVERVPVVSFVLPGWEPEEAGYALRESFGVLCRTGLHCAPLVHEALGTAPAGTVRLSPSGFTADADIEVALEAVGRLLR
jgi:cysteine desulfurase / selenocysteine lyase